MSIRYKILFILLILALSSHFIITAVYYFYSQRTIKTEATNHLEAMANIQQHRLHTFIDTNMEKLKLINSRTQLRLSLKEFNQHHSKSALILVKKILNDAISNTYSIEDIYIIGLDGEIVASANNKHARHLHNKHPLFPKVMEKVAVHSIVDEEDKVTSKILFTAPLKLNGELLGAIVMQINMYTLNEYLSDYTGLGVSGEVLMALNYKDNKMLFFTPLRFKKAPIIVEKGSQTAKPMTLALQNIETMLDDALDYRNEPVIAVTRYLEQLQFGIVVKMDRSEILGSSNELKIIILKLIIGLILAVVLISIFIANIITKPVIDITDTAILISHGDFEKRVEKMSKDELGKLADALNVMADKLIGTNLILEEKVKERTEELQKSNKELEKMSQTDALTGIANRSKFDKQLEISCRRSKRYNKPISLLMIDIDHFKAVNDHYGHQIGDKYLKSVAHVLANTVERVDDLPARFGGEEFTLILGGTNNEGAVLIAETIRQRIIDLQLESLHSQVEPYLTVSIGVCTATPDLEIDAESLIRMADEALYEAKNSGRNRVVSKS